jgi:KipI family sensor histidine kinase inhibitor
LQEGFDYRLHFPAENYILIDFGNRIDEELNKHIIAMAGNLDHKAIVEVIPAYSSILLEFDPQIAQKSELCSFIKSIKAANAQVSGRIHEISVIYGGEQGSDLPFVAQNAGLTEEEVIFMHTAVLYRVFMIGFLPGFCYLGGLDKRLETKRLDVPRALIPAGSVGIAGMQTGIYPEDSPGGWRVIGRTEFKLFNPEGNPIFPIEPGDSIRFKAVQNGR